ncbi:MAG: hypothetical protein NZM16_02760 [Thermoflexus sp.]|uniref:hypothetical protein n=1 Tax=Thermoflexus sp. TaxID=1969742 RepID=UPI0025D34E20|nr:hypothetical protein [Thermoflexus sp.]MCS6962953.1 hypothetical protein [Thermoflexus sp.]MDW8184014.1 haloacid dehalogenase [Anaerolineae bacterium]
MPWEELENIAREIRSGLDAKNTARDTALMRCRELTRLCALSIRAVHREDYVAGKHLLEEAQKAAFVLQTDLAPFPELLYAGYTQDALKEWVEASIVYAVVTAGPLPGPRELNVTEAAYLNGLAEAATELRRRILDLIRTDRFEEAERLLQAMDEIYEVLITMDYPDAITGNLRRATDVVRGTLERTRGELTLSLREHRLQQALQRMEDRAGPDQGE